MTHEKILKINPKTYAFSSNPYASGSQMSGFIY